MNDLLRNDSLFDMSQRGDIYRALFDWLEVSSSHDMNVLLPWGRRKKALIKDRSYQTMNLSLRCLACHKCVRPNLFFPLPSPVPS